MRTKIDYGIDLGTTNSAIARMENGKPVILKSDVQMDTLPSCIAVTPRKSIIQGVAALKAYRTEKLRAAENAGSDSNAYLEFKTTMGTDITYPSSFLNKEFTRGTFRGNITETEIIRKRRKCKFHSNYCPCKI